MYYRAFVSFLLAPERVASRFGLEVLLFHTNVPRGFQLASVDRAVDFLRSELWPIDPVFSGLALRRVALVDDGSLLLRHFRIPYRVRRGFCLVFDQFGVSSVRCPRFLCAPLVYRERLLMCRKEVSDPRPGVVVQAPPVECVVVCPISSLANAFFYYERVASVAVVIVAPR